MNWLVWAGQLSVIFVALGGFYWMIRRERFKAPLDVSTIKHTDIDSTRLRHEVETMATESNAWRDTRLWQLEGYLNLDAGWHLTIITNQRILIQIVQELVTMVHGLGGDTEHIKIPGEPPPPPPIPEPPHR